MTRLLVYKPAAQRELGRMDRSDAERIIHALEVFAATGRGDVQGAEGCAQRPLSLARWHVARLFHSRSAEHRCGERRRQPRSGLLIFHRSSLASNVPAQADRMHFGRMPGEL